jgi:hypothetical protein
LHAVRASSLRVNIPFAVSLTPVQARATTGRAVDPFDHRDGSTTSKRPHAAITTVVNGSVGGLAASAA